MEENESREKIKRVVEVIWERDDDDLNWRGTDRYAEKLFNLKYILKVELIGLKIAGM